jgi:uncharacterized repeat protein (TIGR03803 family)
MKPRRIASPFWAGIAALALTCSITPSIAGAQATYTTLHEFKRGPGGVNGRLLQAADGNMYGTASEGGVYSGGLIYVMRRGANGSWLPPITLHDFKRSEGIKPLAGLTEGLPGLLYGTTSEGAAHGGGSIFVVTLTGAFAVLRHLNPATDGATPKGELTRGLDGFYGTAATGGPSGVGTIFRITASAAFTRLFAFSGPNGAHPTGALTFGPDLNLYGTTRNGGGFGNVFRLGRDGRVTTIHSFFPDSVVTLSGNYWPEGSLTLWWDGTFFGRTTSEWFVDPHHGRRGAIFNITLSGVVKTATSWHGDPTGPLTVGGDGWLYGASQPDTFYRLWPNSVTFETLPTKLFEHVESPSSALVRANDGKMYVATERNGPDVNAVLVSVETSGVRPVHRFTDDGAIPTGTLRKNPDGNLFGVTSFGGGLFKLSPAGQFSKVTDLGTPTGERNYGSLTPLRNGNFLVHQTAALVEITPTGEGIYSTPRSPNNNGAVELDDGSLYVSRFNDGIVLLRPGSDLWEIVHTFEGPDGLAPRGGLMRASDGAIYGTTSEGGAFEGGTIFRFTGASVETLHHFAGPDGAAPLAMLVEGPDGFLYGTTIGGGDTSIAMTGGGTVFKIAKDGSGFTSLHAFTGADGLFPLAELSFGSTGVVYGTAIAGGYGTGTVFAIAPNGAFGVLHRFGLGQGAFPFGGVTESNGALYGATVSGGRANLGVLYRLTGPW